MASLTFAEEMAEGLSELRDEYVGFAMTYQRGATSIALVKVVKGQTKVPLSMQAAGFAEQQATQDIVVEAVQLAAIDEPRQGDQVIETINGFVETYEVVAGMNGARCWHWSDVGHTTIRIHTTMTAREAIP